METKHSKVSLALFIIILIQSLSLASCKNVTRCENDEGCLLTGDQKGVCISSICEESKNFEEPCFSHKQCEASDIKMMCNGVCVCEPGFRFLHDTCQPLDVCESNSDCNDLNDECIEGYCHPPKSMFNLALFGTVSACILAICLVAIIFVYTSRKVRRRQKLFRTISEQRKTPVYVGSMKPNLVVSVSSSSRVPDEPDEIK